MDTQYQQKADRLNATAHNGAQRRKSNKRAVAQRCADRGGKSAERESGSVKRGRKKRRAANGSGYLVQRNGIWTARWKVGYKIVSQSLHTSNRAEAELALARLSAPRIGVAKREAVRKMASAMAATLDDVNDQVRVTRIPISQLYDLWLQSPVRGHATGRTLDSYRTQLAAFQSWLSTRYPDILNARDVSQVVAEEYAKHRTATRSAGTVAKDLNLLAAVWRALSLRYGLEYNPWSSEKIARPSITTNTRRALTDAECDAILAAANERQRAMVLLGLDAGLRLGDVVTLKWKDVDFNRGLIVRETRKTGAAVVNPISERLAEALRLRGGTEAAPHEGWARRPGPHDRRAAAHDREGYVFPEDVARLKANGNTENISREMTRLFERAGIQTRIAVDGGKDISLASFHSLRHTFVSRLMERGVNPYYVQRAVGHSTMTMTAHYDHSAAEEIRRALER